MLNLKYLSIATFVTLILLLAGCANQPTAVGMENLKVVNGKYYRQSVNPQPMVAMPIRDGEVYQCGVGQEVGIFSTISNEQWIVKNSGETVVLLPATDDNVSNTWKQGADKKGTTFYYGVSPRDNKKIVVASRKPKKFMIDLSCIQISNNAYALTEQQAQLYLHNQQIAQQQTMHNEQIAQQKSAQNSRELDAILDRQNETFNTLYKTSNDNINNNMYR